jgi:hypothetical protein
MYAVVVKVSIDDPERAQQGLREQVIPAVRQTPGFVAGYWTRSDDGREGLSWSSSIRRTLLGRPQSASARGSLHLKQ